MNLLRQALAGLALCLVAGASAHAEALEADSGKLLLTEGVTNVEGVGGGGLANWALITGYETRDAVGANVHATAVSLPDYQLRAYGVGVGFFDRIEVSYTRQEFDTGSTGAKLGLGRGFTFDQDIVGVKARVIGDAVYDQDSLLPQIAIGAEFKSNDRGAIIHAVGGQKDSGVDYYVAATKVLLDQNLVLDATLRLTKANQFGILGFGGDRNDNYRTEFEGSAAYLLNKHLAVGAEYRTKPDNLGFAKEDAAFDVFAAYAINKRISVTLAYVDLGDIATFKNQRGAYLSLQAGF